MSADSQTLAKVLVFFSSFSFSFCCCVVFNNALFAYFDATLVKKVI